MELSNHDSEKWCHCAISVCEGSLAALLTRSIYFRRPQARLKTEEREQRATPAAGVVRRGIGEGSRGKRKSIRTRAACINRKKEN